MITSNNQPAALQQEETSINSQTRAIAIKSAIL